MKFTVTKQEGRSSPWEVRYFVDRKAVRRYYGLEPDAEKRRHALAAAFAVGGLDAVKLIDVDADLEQAKVLADAEGRSILELVRLGIAVARGKKGGPPLREAFNRFETRHSEVNLRPKTVTFYSEQLEAFMKAVGETRLTGEITRPQLRQWIDSKPVRSRPHALRASRAWFRWMLRQEPPLIDMDPTAGMSIDSPIEERKILFLHRDKATALLRASSQDIRAAVALMLFAGIRHNELHREETVEGVDVLRWEDIDLARRSITVRSEVAKTRVARTIRKLPANLWEWLRPLAKARGSICETHLRNSMDDARRRVRLAVWGKSILRHTFASHHVAAFGNLNSTALILRHEGDVTLLNSRYREGVSISKADGKKFFSIKPIVTPYRTT